jgi:hypothetical protein
MRFINDGTPVALKRRSDRRKSSDPVGEPPLHSSSGYASGDRMTLTERDGRTTLALMVTPENATEAERAVFEAGREGMRQGFGA